jgi:hypothetical protein
LHRLRVPVNDSLHLVSRGCGVLPHDQWTRLTQALMSLPGAIVDAGSDPVDDALHAAADHSLLVIRPCFLALRRAMAMPTRPTGVVLVCEPGRALAARDVEHALGVPVVAEVPVDPAIARAVDAGLLAARVPRTLQHPLRRVA